MLNSECIIAISDPIAICTIGTDKEGINLLIIVDSKMQINNIKI
ncbi:hypothetical protein CBE01nite_49150 [Clostridium beijerinckii]|nr:hypothetical protein CBE01nite_49150 [Clostridium beijerinckii]